VPYDRLDKCRGQRPPRLELVAPGEGGPSGSQPVCFGCILRIVAAVFVHLLDGTCELFRYFLSPRAAFDRRTPEELRAVRGVVAVIITRCPPQ